MQAIRTPLILYVPGLLPKPRAAVHKEALQRCLIAGVRRADPAAAEHIEQSTHSFDIVAWTYDFYLEHRDIALDTEAIDGVLRQSRATEADIREAVSWVRRVTRSLYRLGDAIPFLIPHLASERMEVHLRDLRRYVHDQNGIAEHTREMLKLPLRAAGESHRPVLLAAHSMGSVIAYDGLWQMSHEHRDSCQVDRFLTMGSPLGQNYLQKRILGHTRTGVDRYPTNIRRWTNLAAVGDLTAIDPALKNDFGAMLELDLVEAIEDIEVFNYFRFEGELNAHAEYGYLANEVTGSVIASWWREHAPDVGGG